MKGTSVQNRNIGANSAKTIFRACHIHDVCGDAARGVLYSPLMPTVALALARHSLPPPPPTSQAISNLLHKTIWTVLYRAVFAPAGASVLHRAAIAGYFCVIQHTECTFNHLTLQRKGK